MAEPHPADFWESHYRAGPVWSGRPNATVVDAVTGLAPGRALDLGCGEGGDAVWLARQGWEVTAVDISPTAVARAGEAAAAAGVDVRLVAADLATWEPDGSYELVTASFFQSPVALTRGAVLRRAAARVVPGGHVLVVSHAAPPPWAADHGHDHGGPDRFLSPQDELAELALTDGWSVVLAETRAREARGPDGRAAELEDSVVLLRRVSVPATTRAVPT